ncbi:MAG TPA: CoA-binding protein [Treponemataceae bacterium]|nr:CoA-binding protein [Treponemataceae bacterium]
MRVLIIGASRNPERYSNMAMNRLIAAGHEALLFNPGIEEIDGMPVHRDLAQVSGPIDTVTLYVSPRHLEPLIDSIIALSPSRVIANPGTENPEFARRFQNAGIRYVEACTLVLLSTGQF